MPSTYEVAGPGAEERGPPGFRLFSNSLQNVEQTEVRDNAGIMRILITEPGGETLRFVIAVTDTEPGHDSCQPEDERSRASLCVGCSLGAAGLSASNCSGFSQRTQSRSNYPQFKAAV